MNSKMNQVPQKDCPENRRLSPNYEFSWFGWIYNTQGSGLHGLFELIYAEGNVNAMLNGKDICRATRARKLIYTLLYGYLMAKLFEFNLGESSNNLKLTINSSLQTLK